MANERTQPVKKMNIGALNLAVWRNDVRFGKDGDARVMYSVTMERRYKDQSGTWQSSGSFRLNDIPKVKLLLEKAYEYLTMEVSDDDDGDAKSRGDDE
jgi:hypothetical protein